MAWNVSSAAAPPRMNRPRRTIAPATPQSSTRRRSPAGTPRNPNRTAKTNRLSSDSDFSMRKPARYSSAAVDESSRYSTAANAAPIAVHTTDQASARRTDGVPREPWRRAMSRAAATNAPRAIQGSTAVLLRVERGLEGLARPASMSRTGAPGHMAEMTTRRLAGLLPLLSPTVSAGGPLSASGRDPILAPMDLAGAQAIVTGAAVGTGRAIAERLAAEGASVVVADIDERGGEETVARIGRDRARFIRADMLDPADVEALVNAAARLRVLVNNAGGWLGPPHFPDATPAQWGATLDLNLRSAMLATQLPPEPMRRARGGAIVNIASTAGLGRSRTSRPSTAPPRPGSSGSPLRCARCAASASPASCPTGSAPSAPRPSSRR